MRKPIRIIALAVGAMLAAGLFIAARSGKRKPQQQAMLTFLSYTNFGVPDGKRRVRYDRFAAFCLSNASPLRATYGAESVEVWTEAGWQTNWLRGTPTNWLHFSSGFGPGQSSIFLVPPPTNSKWRIRLGLQEHATGWDGYRDRFDDYRVNRRNTTKREMFSGRRYELTSPEVTQ